MEFHEKLQELRKQKGITQEELAKSLFVSRAAISKWDSGRGYPNIDSLKMVAQFFGITVDALLSGDELLSIAEAESLQKERHARDRLYGLLDLSAAMLLFLPLFATAAEGVIQIGSLLSLVGMQPYLRIFDLLLVGGMIITGVLTLSLQSCERPLWLKCKTVLSLAFGTALLLLLMISAQPYAAVFAFALLAIKAFWLIKRP